jgi:hypothetical protein
MNHYNRFLSSVDKHIDVELARYAIFCLAAKIAGFLLAQRPGAANFALLPPLFSDHPQKRTIAAAPSLPSWSKKMQKQYEKAIRFVLPVRRSG